MVLCSAVPLDIALTVFYYGAVMKPLKIISLLLPVSIFFLSTGCLVLPGFDRGPTDKTESVAQSQTLVTSCLGILGNGNYVRCSEQRDPTRQKVMSEICGDEEKGLKGYHFFNKACPIENRVGICTYFDDSRDSTASDYWYGPTYSASTAQEQCSVLGGVF